jgi:hypothetical protein
MPGENSRIHEFPVNPRFSLGVARWLDRSPFACREESNVAGGLRQQSTYLFPIHTRALTGDSGARTID